LVSRSRDGRIRSNLFRDESVGREEGPNSEPDAGAMKIARMARIISTDRRKRGFTASPRSHPEEV